MLPADIPADVPADVPADIPVDIGADPARDAARRELARAVYAGHRPSLLERLGTWISDTVDDLLRAASSASPGGTAGLVVVLVVIVAMVVVVRWRLGRTARSAAARTPVLEGRGRIADEHRRIADEHAAAGRFDDAVRERMRGLVRGLEERAVLEPRPGRTAGEAAREAGAELPGVAAPLAEAARRFDETVYGGRRADAAADERMRAIDAEVGAARTVPA